MSGDKQARLRVELPDGRVFHSTSVIQDEIEQQPHQYASEMRVWLNGAAITLATYIREPISHNFTVPEKKPVPQSAKTTEELIAERFEGIDQRIREVSGAWKDAHDALEDAMLKQREGWAQRFAYIDKKIEANGISDDSLKAWNETAKRINDRLDRIESRMVPLESYYDVAHTCVHTTPDEAKKLEARLVALEQPHLQLPSGQFQHICDRLKALEKGFTECTISRHEFKELQDQVEELDGINQRVKVLSDAVMPNAEQTLPRRVAKLESWRTDREAWELKQSQRVEKLETKPLPDDRGRFMRIERSLDMLDKAYVELDKRIISIEKLERDSINPIDGFKYGLGSKPRDVSNPVFFNRLAFPNPLPEDLKTPEFNALWDVVKQWDIAFPAAYDGRTGGEGNHVMALLQALRAHGLRVVRADTAGEEGEGIKVVIHDFPRDTDGRPLPLNVTAEALQKLRATRVLVDMGGIGKTAAEMLRTQWLLPVEPLPKRTNPVPRSPDCPAHDTRCRPGACWVNERTTRGRVY